MELWLKLASDLLKAIAKPALQEIDKKIAEALVIAKEALDNSSLTIAEVKSLKAQMSAAMAIDTSLKGQGKVIILTRINGIDKVKIMDVKPNMTIEEYKSLIETLETQYGDNMVWVGDTPSTFKKPRVKG
jgi:hypothetical protein